MAKEYRGKIRIIGDILHAVNGEPGIGVTRLLFLSNLSHERLTDYLGDLKTRALLEERDVQGKKAYHITERGHKFLVEVQRVRSFMQDFGLEM
jgi:predicted transcriptional regulator